MNILAGTIALLVVGGLFAKHTSFILMYGSIFEEVRSGIHHRRNTLNRGRWFWQKLNELITCQLCLTAQVSIWTVGLPTVSILTWRFPNMLSQLTTRDMPTLVEGLFFLFVWFVVSIVNAAAAMAFWNLTEHLPHVLQETERSNRAREEILSAQVQASVSPALVDVAEKVGEAVRQVPVMNLEDWRELLLTLSRSCDGIGCGSSRRDCRNEQVETFGRKVAKRYSLNILAQRKLVRELGIAAREFVQLRREIRDQDTRAERVWAELEPKLPTVREDGVASESEAPTELMTFDTFRQMLDDLAQSCGSIGDPNTRRACRIQAIDAFATRLSEHHVLSMPLQRRLTLTLGEAVRDFYLLLRDSQDTDEAVERTWMQYEEHFRDLRDAA